MSNLFTNPLPAPRRILTSHVSEIPKSPFEPAVSVQDTLLPQNSELEGKAGNSIVWTVGSVPVPSSENLSNEDAALKIYRGGVSGNIGEIMRPGVNCRFNDLAPGAVVPMHRTSSTDILIWLSGEGILITPSASYDPVQHPDGPIEVTETIIKPGDVIVQRGTLHAWKNPSTTEWARSIGVGIIAEELVREGGENTLEPCFIMSAVNY